MSHPLCGALVAGAFYFCFRGIDSRRLAPFVPMLLLLGLAFHVRPFTAFLAAVALSAASLWAFRDRRGLLLRLFATLAAGGVCIVGSVLLYHWVYTSSPLLSPYALYRPDAGLAELNVSPQRVLRSMTRMTRFGLQSTFLTTAPGLLILAAYAFWRFRDRSVKVWALGLYFPMLALGYSLNPLASGSEIGQRFWFEGFFGMAILSAAAFVDLVRRFKVDPATVRVMVVAQVLSQSVLTFRLLEGLHDRYYGYAAVTEAALALKDCRCAVFLDLKKPFLGEHLNLNPARWREADVFYLIDPGPDEREAWARRFGFDRWKLLSYDPAEGVVRVQ
jgi:hypothetical protein